MERNYMNVNEVYPILDMINRKVKQGKGTTYNMESPLVSDVVTDPSQWQVESFEVFRDIENPIDKEVIKEIVIVYRNGAIDTVTLTRGLVPPVDGTVQDSEYINNLMITGITVTTEYSEEVQTVQVILTKEDLYGKFKRADLIYGDNEENESYSDSDEYENPNDFYDNTPENDEDTEDEIDYADEIYEEGDEQFPSDSGWEEDSEPEEPIDMDALVPEESTEQDSFEDYDDTVIPDYIGDDPLEDEDGDS